MIHTQGLGTLDLRTLVHIPTWRTIPFSKCLITMVIVSPLNRAIPLPNGRTSWLINRGDSNHLLNGMILQVALVVFDWGLECFFFKLRPF